MTASDLTLVRGVCPHDCPDSCGTLTEVRDGRAVRFSADPEHPITQGWLCAKVRPYLERVYHPDRLRHPLRRVGPKGAGRWERVGWDDAVAEIAARWKQISAEYGAEAILPYSYSGTLGMVQLAVASERLWNRMGASRLERSICGAAAEHAVKLTLGARLAPDYRDVRHSKLVIIWGHNPVSTGPHFMPFLREAQRAGTEVIVIDPRRTRTAQGADLHLAPRPATDGALALGLGHVIVAEGLYDERWLAAHTLGWPELRQRLEEYPPERVAEITGLEAETIVMLARKYATAKPALIKIADGLQRHRNGGQTVRSILTLPALTGQYGLRGGGLAYSASDYVAQALDGEVVSRRAQSPPPGRKVNMNRLGAALLGEASDPPVKALFVFCSNPAAIAPNAGKIAQGLRREDLFTVVHELFMTDTADYADIVLPATSPLEHVDLHRAYGHSLISYNAPAIAPLEESKSNWDVMRLLAEAMGFEEPWLKQSADEIVDDIVLSAAAKSPLFAGITPERLRASGALPLNLPEDFVPFADGRFGTPSGKVELRCARLADEGVDPLPGYIPAFEEGSLDERASDGRLVLISGAAHHFVTSSMANQSSLLAKEGSPFVEIHPEDAQVRGIATGDTVRIENEYGDCELRAVVTDAVRRGVLASPKGFWARFSPDRRNVNWTAPDVLGDMAGQSTFHSNLVRIRRV
jgi:anaerobic selenocysteine-containing dehydrogenase